MDDRSEIARAAAEAAARSSYGKLVAWLAARTRDVAGAEDALADAFAAALERWPRTGVPAQPEAWLLAVARRRDVDAVRRRLTGEAARMSGEELPDDRLRLMFACAHPAIEASVRAPLILQTILGFDAATIASAFLVSPATMGQRLVRAKARIRETGIPFRVPEKAELGERLGAVLEAIYATFAEGWSDPTGTDSRRRNLAGEGIWLGRLVASLMPDEPEALGLLALMLFAEARRSARRGPDGDFVPLAEQDIALWDDSLIDEAEALLAGAAQRGLIGRYQLEAAVQSAHTARRRGSGTDWAAIRQLYDALLSVAGSPVVAINRAVAIAETEGATAGLAALYVLGDDKRLQDYQPYWAARAGLLARLGNTKQAAQAYDQAIGLERDPALRRFLQGEKAKLVGG
ncbi:RNA polymerase subunit sigma-70 [Mesorhizobium sp. M2A.F.Ca.ET.037.01.1.1]|uniref:RNA polymerase sigma factor n=1 Tax=unclassified Mesorhizobium TaxID=325217 RepID=UPI000FC9A9F3|nr:MULTISPECIES: DUF6596 domain-containing protein [unclassified Mesorhizobium]RUX07855.1 RNA polymerase subunit sigma-70 [Mesorhizobium sp. M2A.F.Ca.ET.037.01.1.1]RWA78540.1 MAG: RNA polymerase subunit sigma-70 [Mesorhizobium sp.]